MSYEQKSKFNWILDNGHGSDTPGKRSPKLIDGRQFFEYRFNRDIVERMMDLLQEKEIDCFNLVPEEEDISLDIRVKRANDLNRVGPCLLVSVHSNAFGEGSRFTAPRGVATYYFEGSKPGRKIASLFQENLVQNTGWRNREIRPSKLKILRDTTMPAVLTETGFYTNREQLEYLLDNDWREIIASSHVEAIEEIELMGPAFFETKGRIHDFQD